MNKISLKHEFLKGIIKENPVLCLVLGTCPTLAVTTSATNAVGMGIAATIVLTFSNATISCLRHIIPHKVRIPAYITIIAAFVTVVQMLVKAYAPSLNNSLGIYLPLIVVNCIILGRAEMFASKNPILASILDGLGMGIGFTLALFCMGIIREFFGAGTIFNISITSHLFDPITVFILAPGGFFVFGILIAIVTIISKKQKVSNKKNVNCSNCISCPMNESCNTVKK